MHRRRSALSTVAAAPGRRCRQRQQMRSVHERHVRQSLRKIAEHPASMNIVLLGQQADIIAQCEQSLEERLPFIAAAGQDERIG